MRIALHWTLLLTILLGSVVSPCLADGPAAKADFYVAPNGSDANPGSETSPFATLQRARDAVRQRIAAGLSGDIVVNLRGGVYPLEDTIVFRPEDSGTGTHSITYAAYPGEAPVLSGARRITEWQKGEGDLWTTSLPDVKAGKWYPRQLFVDGSRRQRARTPNDGFLRGMKSSDGITVIVPPEQLQPWKNLADVELVTLVEWTASRARLHQVDHASGKLVFPQQTLQFLEGDGLKHIRRNVANFPYYFENAREMLDMPGEWYLDRTTGILSYWPPNGEDPRRSVALLPRLQHLVQITGTRERPVRNVRLKGLSFTGADFLPPNPYMPDQAGFTTSSNLAPDAAIRLLYAQNCRLDDCRITHVGGTAISLGAGCLGNTLSGNLIRHIGANGLEVGTRDAHPENLRDVVRDNTIANNHIAHCGLDYSGCLGVWVGITDHTTVAHNLIHDVPYTGISVGWRWSPEDTACRRNIIEYNHIHRVVQLLADGGGVYLLGSQPGSVLRGNLVHDIAHYSGYAENQGFFFDQGSKGWHVEGNVIYSTAEGPIRHNDSSTENQTWGKNSFGPKPSEPDFPKAAAEKAGLEPAYRQRLSAKL